MKSDKQESAQFTVERLCIYVPAFQVQPLHNQWHMEYLQINKWEILVKLYITFFWHLDTEYNASASGISLWKCNRLHLDQQIMAATFLLNTPSSDFLPSYNR